MNTIQFIHSGWAYIVLIVLVLATLNALYKLFADKPFDAIDFRLALFGLITMHIQLLIGIVLWFTKGYFDEMSMGELMKNDGMRKLVVEHPITMIIAVTLITIGYSKHKKKLVSRSKFKMLSIFYTIALLLVLYMIPWAKWFQ